MAKRDRGLRRIRPVITALIIGLVTVLPVAGQRGSTGADFPGTPTPSGAPASRGTLDQTGTIEIQIDRPVVYPDTRDTRRLLEDALVQAARHTERVYPGFMVTVGWSDPTPVEDGSGKRDRQNDTIERYRLSVNAIRDGGSNTISLTLTGTRGDSVGRQATAMPLTGEWEGTLYRDLSQQFGYLVAQARGFPRLREDTAPRFVDELYLGELVGSTITTEGGTPYPYSVAVTADGDVVVGAITVAIRFSPELRVLELPGASLLNEGNYSSAMTVAVTPAGSVVTRPSMGRELYRYRPGAVEPERIRNPLTGQGGMAALPDGSIVVVDYANRRAARLEGRSATPLDLFPDEYTYIPAVAAGPEGNIWAYDTMARLIRIFSPDGGKLDSVVPMLPMEQAAGVKAIAVGEGGDFLLLTTGGLWRFDRSGHAVWMIDAIDDPAGSPLGQMMGVAWHEPTGSVYLTDYMGQRVIRLVETTRTGAVSTDRFTRRILELNEELRRAGADTGRRGEVFAAKAQLYQERGALEMAQAQWQLALEEDPFSMDAIDRIDTIESSLLQRQVSLLDERVRNLLDEYGRETARRDFSRAVRLYERILNLEPGNEEMRRAKRALEAQFEERGGPTPPPYPVEIADLSVEPLFPVLLRRYHDGGAGSFELRNPGDRAVRIRSAVATAGSFTEAPTPIDLPRRLGPGERVSVGVPLLLDREVLSLEEDLPIQLSIRLEYEVEANRGGSTGDGDGTGAPGDGAIFAVTADASTTLHRRSALVWDDSAKLASFVTPNDEVVAGFALRVLAGLERGTPGIGAEDGTARGIAAVSPRIARAIRLTDALGRYGINYVEDPRTPFSEVQGAAHAVDTVRFPRLTLYYRSGDCDDTSALLASLFEAAGLDTAIVTTPGHVLIAVDTKEPVSNRWMFETTTTTAIAHEGTLWIPVETTVVDDGFAVAWQEGSHLVGTNLDEGAVEIIPTRNARDRYPALPLPAPSFTITEPPVTAIRAMVDTSFRHVNEIVYTAGRSALDRDLETRAGTRRIPILNRIGIMEARFGYTDRARDVFTEIIELRNSYVPAYVNLANLALLEGRTDEALARLDQARLLDPDSPVVIDLIARAHYAAGNGRAAREAVRQLAGIDPERAGRLSMIVSTTGTAVSGEANGNGVNRGESGSVGGGEGDPATTAGRASRAGSLAEVIGALPPAEWLVED
ncbi:MAG: tetratricopeptide repeat protein [Alkalispirochaeta sp.]